MIDRYVVVTITEGTESRNRLWLYPLTTSKGGACSASRSRSSTSPAAEMHTIELVDDRLYLQTDLDAPRGRIVWFDVTAPVTRRRSPRLIEVFRPERGHAARGERRPAAGMAVATLADVAPVVQLLELDGAVRHRPALDGGSLVGLEGRKDDHELFVGLSSVTAPTSAYRGGHRHREPSRPCRTCCRRPRRRCRIR